MVLRESLMLWNWVLNKETGKPERVSEISEDEVMLLTQWLYSYGEIDPIRISVEILERNGFIWDGQYACFKRGRTSVEYYKHEGIIREWYIHKDGSRELMAQSRPGVRFIHELQNWLRMSGIKIDIDLLK